MSLGGKSHLPALPLPCDISLPFPHGDHCLLPPRTLDSGEAAGSLG